MILIWGLCISRAFVFFSSPVNKDLVALIKRDSSVLPRIGALSEVKNYYCSKFFNLLEIISFYGWLFDHVHEFGCSFSKKICFILLILMEICRRIWNTLPLIVRYFFCPQIPCVLFFFVTSNC